MSTVATSKAVRGMTAIVTGSSTGIGLQTAIQLARRNEYETVVFAVRNPAKAAKAIPAALVDKAVVMTLDLTSFESVESFVADLAGKGITSIDRLVLNAGVNDYSIPGKSTTVDGIDEIWQVNFVSHFYLTLLLLPVMAPKGRVVCLSSWMHWFGSPARFGDLLSARKPGVLNYYADSKLAMAVFAHELNRHERSGVTGIAVNPGSVNSDIFRTWYIGIIGTILRWLINSLLLSCADGAKTSVYACTEPTLKGRFEYLSPYGQIRGWGWLVSVLSDLYWFTVVADKKRMIGVCSDNVTAKSSGETLVTIATEAVSRTSATRDVRIKQLINLYL